MTTEEFSNEFDTLLQAFRLTQDEGIQNYLAFDEYEKSVFLTKSQESLVLSLYQSFELNESNRKSLEKLVKTVVLQPTISSEKVLSNKSFTVPAIDDKVLFYIYEQVTLDDEKLGCYNGNTALVTPVTHDEYFKIERNPFRKSNHRRVLRLNALMDGQEDIELISEYNIKDYLVRYLSKPSPIILTDLEDSLSIDGYTTTTECILNPALHRQILEDAVRMAIASKVNAGNNNQ